MVMYLLKIGFPENVDATLVYKPSILELRLPTYEEKCSCMHVKDFRQFLQNLLEIFLQNKGDSLAEFCFFKPRVSACAFGRPGAPPVLTPTCATPTPRESELEEQVHVCIGKHNIMRKQGEVPVRVGDNGAEDGDTLDGAEPKLGCMGLVEFTSGSANRELVCTGAI